MTNQFDTQALLQYAYTHGLITHEQYEQSQQHEFESSSIQDMLQEAGVLSFSQIEKIKSLFALMPYWQDSTGSIDIDAMAQVSPAQITEHRVVCIRDDSGNKCVLTDKESVHPDMKRFVGDATVFRASEHTLDYYLQDYTGVHQETIIDDIATVARRVRRVEDFGSPVFKNLFPHNYRQEIAEDISTGKLIRRIVLLAELYRAQSIIIRPQPDRLLVLAQVGKETHELVNLPQAILASLCFKLQYWADMPLQDVVDRITTGSIASSISGLTYNCELVFTPTVSGPSITITPNHGQGKGVQAMSELKLDAQHQLRLAGMVDAQQGLCVVSGHSESGKTYAYYRLLEMIATNCRAVSFEDTHEYIVESAEQVLGGSNVLREVRAAAAVYAAVGVRVAHKIPWGSLSALATRKIVLVEAREGIVSVVDRIHKQGVDSRVLMQTGFVNLVSYPVRSQRPNTQRTLRSEEISMLQEYISLAELHELGQSIPGFVAKSWQEMTWADVNNESGRLMWFKKRMLETQGEGTRYYRGLVDVAKLLDLESKPTKHAFAQTIRREQKRALVPTMIESVLGGELAVSEIIEMLRKQ